MLLSEIIKRIEDRCPASWAEEWDNPGLNAGAYDIDIKKISIALDVNRHSISEVLNNGSNMLLTHHPSIFRPLKNIRYSSSDPTAVVTAIKNDIALYSMHTNWDVSPEGVNVILGNLLKLNPPSPLIKTINDDKVWGLGCIGTLADEQNPEEFFRSVKAKLKLPDTIMYKAKTTKKINRVAVAGGSCGDLWSEALNNGADVFITADISYHQREDALEAGMSVISCDHGKMEYISLNKLSDIVRELTELPVILIEPQYRNLNYE